MEYFHIPISLEPDRIQLSYFKLRLFDLTFDIGLQRYRDKQIRVCGKDFIFLYDDLKF